MKSLATNVVVIALTVLAALAMFRPFDWDTPAVLPPAPAEAAPTEPDPGERFRYELTMAEVLHELHYRESRMGLDPRSHRGYVGPAGELGEYQVTPVFVADVRRLSGITIDPFDTESCRRGIAIWLDHYAPKVGATTLAEFCELYRRGARGYRRWREAQSRQQ